MQTIGYMHVLCNSSLYTGKKKSFKHMHAAVHTFLIQYIEYYHNTSSIHIVRAHI